MKWLVFTVIGIVVVILVLFFPIQGGAQVPSITLDWTAPGDDGAVGTATAYQMRWSATAPDTTSQSAMDSWWATATVVSGLPVPQIAGTTQTMVVTRAGGWPAGATYHFVLKACDEVPNCSAYSNVARKTILDVTPPARVIDLIAR